MEAQQSAITVADVMRPATTTVEQDAHVAAAAYLMKHAGATALVVLDDMKHKHPIGIITEADVVDLIGEGKDVNNVRIRDVMTKSPTVCGKTTSIRDAGETMISGKFRHMPVVDDEGVIGMIEIQDVSRALLGPSA